MDQIMDNLRKNWPVILFVGGAVVWYANVQFDISQLKASNEDQKAQIAALITARDGQTVKTSEDLARIREDIAAIKTKLQIR